jgi:hypothetical protein
MNSSQFGPKRKITMGGRSPSAKPAAYKKGGFVKKPMPFGGPPGKKPMKGKSGC